MEMNGFIFFDILAEPLVQIVQITISLSGKQKKSRMMTGIGCGGLYD